MLETSIFYGPSKFVFATTQPSTWGLGTSDVKQGDSLQHPPVILCFGYQHSVSQSEEKRFFRLFDIKSYSYTRMASEDVNFTSSSDSEDSEVNFIADYMLEVEGSPNSSDQDGQDLDKELEAYADEPLADDDD